MTTPLLQIQGVHKRYASVHAVNDVSFDVHVGEIVALLGPNGAGKSSLIRMLMGLTRPDAGAIRLFLRGPSAEAPRPIDLGYLPEDRGLYPDVGVLRTLVHFAVLRGMPRIAARQAGLGWLERMELVDRAEEPLKALSKGNQQKVQFISSILHGPRFAVLDEPFSGLDPLNQDVFLALIQELRDGGTTILLSAHQMQLVERIADRVIVMNRGRSLLNGTMPEIRRMWATGSRLRLRIAGERDVGFLAAHSGVRAEPVGEDEVEVLVDDGVAMGPVLAALGDRLDIREVHSFPVTLHDVYVRAVSGDGARQEVVA